MRPVGAAVKIASAVAGGELDLDGALSITLGSRRRGRNTNFLDGVSLGLDDGKEPVRTFQNIVLNVNAIHRDIEHGLGQPIDGRLSGPTSRRRARQKEQKIQSIARGIRKLGNLPARNRGAHRGRLSLHQLAAAHDRNRLAFGADFQGHLDARRRTDVDLDVGNRGRLKTVRYDCRGINAVRESGDYENSLTIRYGRKFLTRNTLDCHDRACDHSALRVNDSPSKRSRRTNMPKC